MRIRFWGVRSGRPRALSPLHYRQRLHQVLEHALQKGLHPDNIAGFLDDLPANLSTVLGGNTACLSCEIAPDTWCIFDAGSGLINLGQELMQGPCGSGQGHNHIFLSHCHVDRLEGLAHFAPLQVAGNQIHIYMPDDRLKWRLIKYFSTPYFARQLDDALADVHFHPMGENESVTLHELQIDSRPLQHPGGSFAYRMRANQANFLIYASGGQLPVDSSQGFKSDDPFFSRARILILDAGRMDENDSDGEQPTWGLTSCQEAIQCGHAWQAEHLLLTNHPAVASDLTIWQNFQAALEALEISSQNTESMTRTYLAREGLSLKMGSA